MKMIIIGICIYSILSILFNVKEVISPSSLLTKQQRMIVHAVSILWTVIVWMEYVLDCNLENGYLTQIQNPLYIIMMIPLLLTLGISIIAFVKCIISHES